MEIVEMTYKEWEEKYKPVCSVDRAVYGHIPSNSDPLTVWTVHNMDGVNWIVNGVHIVNNVGFMVTEIPFANDKELTIIVILPDDPPYKRDENGEIIWEE